MKLALSLLVWTLIALGALFVLGPDTSRELPKPKPPPSQPKDHASVPFTGALEIGSALYVRLESASAAAC